MKLNKAYRKSSFLLLILTLGLMVTSIAYAIDITVDGVKEAAWAGAGGQIPGKQVDPNETDIPDAFDVEEFLYTNSNTKMFFAIDTYADTTFSPSPAPAIVICLDTDGNTATGQAYANCNGMIGIDRTVYLTRPNIFSPDIETLVFDGAPGSGTIIGSAVTEEAFSGDFVEISVDLASLGLSGSSCITTLTGAVYFDNGLSNPDDNTPDTGQFAVSCGGPTAVSYKSAQSSVSNMNDLLNWGLTVLLGFTAGFMMVRHQKGKNQK